MCEGTVGWAGLGQTLPSLCALQPDLPVHLWQSRFISYTLLLPRPPLWAF